MGIDVLLGEFLYGFLDRFVADSYSRFPPEVMPWARLLACTVNALASMWHRNSLIGLGELTDRADAR